MVDELVDGGVVGVGSSAERWWVGALVGEFSQAGAQETVVDAGEELSMPTPIGSDRVAVGPGGAFDQSRLRPPKPSSVP